MDNIAIIESRDTQHVFLNLTCREASSIFIRWKESGVEVQESPHYLVGKRPKAKGSMGKRSVRLEFVRDDVIPDRVDHGEAIVILTEQLATVDYWEWRDDKGRYGSRIAYEDFCYQRAQSLELVVPQTEMPISDLHVVTKDLRKQTMEKGMEQHRNKDDFEKTLEFSKQNFGDYLRKGIYTRWQHFKAADDWKLFNFIKVDTTDIYFKKGNRISIPFYDKGYRRRELLIGYYWTIGDIPMSNFTDYGMHTLTRDDTIVRMEEREAQTFVDDSQSVQSTTEDGLTTTRINTEHGTITTFRPAEVFAGTTISGRVYAEASGETSEELETNRAQLNKYSLGDNLEPVMVADQYVVVSIPDSPGTEARIGLRDPEGELKTELELPDIIYTGFDPIMSPIFPPWMQAGQPAAIQYPSDGVLTTTEIYLSDKEVELLAESSDGRGIVYTPRDLPAGPAPINILEDGTAYSGTTNILTVDLQATKFQLREGESTIITVNVCGFEGLDEEVYLKLENLNPGILSFTDQLFLIKPSMLDEQGCFQRQYIGIGIRPGDWNISGTLISSDDEFCLFKVKDVVDARDCLGIEKNDIVCIKCRPDGSCPNPSQAYLKRWGPSRCLIRLEPEKKGCRSCEDGTFLSRDRWKYRK